MASPLLFFSASLIGCVDFFDLLFSNLFTSSLLIYFYLNVQQNITTSESQRHLIIYQKDFFSHSFLKQQVKKIDAAFDWLKYTVVS